LGVQRQNTAFAVDLDDGIRRRLQQFAGIGAPRAPESELPFPCQSDLTQLGDRCPLLSMTMLTVPSCQGTLQTFTSIAAAVVSYRRASRARLAFTDPLHAPGRSATDKISLFPPEMALCAGGPQSNPARPVSLQ